MNRSGHADELGPAHKVALRLARLFIPGNSGGIVRFCGASRAGTGGSAFRLGLATLEILPQRRAQTPLLPYLLSALWTIVHGRKVTTRRLVTEGLRRNRRSLDARACASSSLMARIAALAAVSIVRDFRIRPGAAVAQW
jgi:hypothetical protein